MTYPSADTLRHLLGVVNDMKLNCGQMASLCDCLFAKVCTSPHKNDVFTATRLQTVVAYQAPGTAVGCRAFEGSNCFPDGYWPFGLHLLQRMTDCDSVNIHTVLQPPIFPAPPVRVSPSPFLLLPDYSLFISAQCAFGHL